MLDNPAYSSIPALESAMYDGQARNRLYQQFKGLRRITDEDLLMLIELEPCLTDIIGMPFFYLLYNTQCEYQLEYRYLPIFMPLNQISSGKLIKVKIDFSGMPEYSMRYIKNRQLHELGFSSQTMSLSMMTFLLHKFRDKRKIENHRIQCHVAMYFINCANHLSLPPFRCVAHELYNDINRKMIPLVVEKFKRKHSKRLTYQEKFHSFWQQGNFAHALKCRDEIKSILKSITAIGAVPRTNIIELYNAVLFPNPLTNLKTYLSLTNQSFHRELTAFRSDPMPFINRASINI